MKYGVKFVIALACAALAGGLQLVAAMQRARPVQFLAVRAKAPVAPGQVFEDALFEEFRINADQAGSLKTTAVAWHDRALLFGRQSVTRLEPGDLIQHRDVESPELTLDLAKDEYGIVVPLSGSAIESGLLMVGGEIGFTLASGPEGPGRGAEESPDPVGAGGEGDAVKPSAAPVTPSAETLRPGEILGPFRLVTIGARTTRFGRGGGSGTVTVAAKLAPDGRLDAKARKLMTLTGGGGPRLHMVLYGSNRTSEKRP
jgi:hypothetical protein